MKYIVTGGAGFIGSHLVEELAKQNHEVVILDNLSYGKLENIAQFLNKGSISFVNGSISDLDMLKRIFETADGIYHEAAIASVPFSVSNPLETHEANLSGTLNVLCAARDCGVKKVVFASTAAVYGDKPELPKDEAMVPDTLSPYAVSKLSSEYYCSVFTQLYGIETTSLRYFNVFGPRQDPHSPYSGVMTKFISAVLRNEPITIFGDGAQTRDFVYVRDVVQANIRAMESHKSGIFNIGSGHRISVLTLAEIIMDIIGTTVPIKFAPPANGDVRDSFADITKAKQLLRYAPHFDLRSGLEETVAWFRQKT